MQKKLQPALRSCTQFDDLTKTSREQKRFEHDISFVCFKEEQKVKSYGSTQGLERWQFSAINASIAALRRFASLSDAERAIQAGRA